VYWEKVSAVEKPTRRYVFQEVTFSPSSDGKECCVEKELVFCLGGPGWPRKVRAG